MIVSATHQQIASPHKLFRGIDLPALAFASARACSCGELVATSVAEKGLHVGHVDR
jgi:hypothetical protein